MKTLLLMAWRNLWRNTRRTMITLGAFVFGLMLLLLIYGVTFGFLNQMINEAAQALNGHLVLQQQGYRKTRDSKLRLQDPAALTKLFAKDKRVVAYSTRLLGRGMVSSSHGVRSVEMMATDPTQDSKVIKLYRTLQKGGRLPRTLDPKRSITRQIPEALLGADAAKALDVSVGSKIVLKTPDADGDPVDIPLRIAGIYKTGSKAMDGRYVVMNLSDAARYLDTGKSVHQVIVRLKEHTLLPGVLKTLNHSLTADQKKQVDVLPWYKMSPDLKGMIDTSLVSIDVSLVFVLIIVLLGVLNTMLMSVFERTREIGVMKSLGTRPSSILVVFTAEALMLSMLGAVIGVALGLGLNFWLEMTGGISLRPFMPETKVIMSGFAMEPVMEVMNTWEGTLKPLLATLFCALLAGFYPAWKASRLLPTEAMRHT
jgi:ABC-type lipoprotein release transport system permease subunit